MQAYCFGCRAHREIADAREVVMKNGQPLTQGKCSRCGRKVSRMSPLRERADD